MPSFVTLQDQFGDTLDVQTDNTKSAVAFRFNTEGGNPFICLNEAEATRLRDILIERLPLGDKQ